MEAALPPLRRLPRAPPRVAIALDGVEFILLKVALIAAHSWDYAVASIGVGFCMVVVMTMTMVVGSPNRGEGTTDRIPDDLSNLGQSAR